MNSGIGSFRGNVIVALVSTKGGVGKTTLSGHLAVEAERCGVGPVALIDMDPQGSLSHWWNARERPTPMFVESTHERLAPDLGRLDELGIALTIIDTPPAPFNIIEAAAQLSDLIVMPLRAGPHDMRTLPATLSIVEPLGKPVIFVLNGATVGARITNEAISLLSQYGPLAPVVHQRVDYAASMIDGRTAMEIKSASPATEEIRALWSYLHRRCGQAQAALLQHQVRA